MKKSSPNINTARLLWSFGMTLVCAVMARADESEPQAAIPAGIQFETYSLILDNNIFDSNRQDRARLEAERRRAMENSIPVDRFSLVGTMHTDGKPLAFFSGSSRDYRAVLKPNETIAGYQVTEITEKLVTLEKDGESIEFIVGMGMSRQGDGPWEFIRDAGRDFRGAIGQSSSSRSSRGNSNPSRPSADTPSASSETTSSSGASKSDILKQMMERRRQQMNQ